MLDLIKDYVRINNLSPAESQSSVYEFDCIIPDVMPDMQKILAVDTYAETTSVDKTSEGANISFKINYKILYLSDSDKQIKAFSAVSEHSVKIKIPGISAGDTLQILCRVEKTDSVYINSRKISVKTTVRVEALQKSSTEAGICIGLSGTDDIQCQKDSIAISNLAESISKQFDIDEEIELSGGKAAYKEILRSDAMLSDISHSIIGDKIQIKGNLQICTLYIADDTSDSLQIIENEIPFAHSIEIENISENISHHTDYLLNKYSVEALPDLDGENRILHVSATILANIDAYSLCQQEFLTDAYSLSQNFTLSTSSVKAMLISEEISGQFVLRDSASKTDELPEIAQIVNVTALPGEYSCTASEGKVTVTGNIICNVLYLAEDADAPIASFAATVPFVQNFDCPQVTDGMQVLASICVNHISFNIMSPSETELRISVAIKGTAIKQCNFETICEIILPDTPYLEDASDRPAILLYVVQQGDTLWKIAKRYNAPLELLKEINQLKNPDMLYPGQKLLIPR